MSMLFLPEKWFLKAVNIRTSILLFDSLLKLQIIAILTEL